MWKTRVMDIKRLQVNASSCIEGTICLYSKRVNRCQGDSFSNVGTRTGAIKLAMAGTYIGLIRSIFSFVGLLNTDSIIVS